jgi:hypothetical protein
MSLLLLASWDCGFESSKDNGFLPVVSVVCCQVESLLCVDHSSTGVLPRVVCLSAITKSRKGKS